MDEQKGIPEHTGVTELIEAAEEVAALLKKVHDPNCLTPENCPTRTAIIRLDDAIATTRLNLCPQN